ncbi:MAG: 2-hydroxychromene-2-carboxylate isomerase [Pseudomonadota bacterium]
MTKTVEFLYDFGSPNAYFAWRVLPGIAEKAGADLVLKPVLLGGVFKATGNQSPVMAYANVQGKLAYENLEMQRYIAKHGLTSFTFNPHFPQNSLLMMRAAMVAEAQSTLHPYTEACFKAMWEDGAKLDEPETFVSVLTEAGLNGQALLEGAQDPAHKEALKTATAQAVERGIFGVPTIFVGDDMYFGKERMGQIEEALA